MDDYINFDSFEGNSTNGNSRGAQHNTYSLPSNLLFPVDDINTNVLGMLDNTDLKQMYVNPAAGDATDFDPDQFFDGDGKGEPQDFVKPEGELNLQSFGLDNNYVNNNQMLYNDNTNNLLDFLNNQYFTPNTKLKLSAATPVHGNGTNILPQATYFNNANTNPQLALSPSSFGGESADQYGSLKSPIAISLAHSNSNNTTGSLTPVVRSPSNQVHLLPKQPLSREEKLRRRREFHNAVERRRRDHIKDRIKDLSKLVPPMMLLYDEQGKQMKPNKAATLTKTVEYVGALNRVVEGQKKRRDEIIAKIIELRNQSEPLNFAEGNFNVDMDSGGNFNFQ